MNIPIIRAGRRIRQESAAHDTRSGAAGERRIYHRERRAATPAIPSPRKRLRA